MSDETLGHVQVELNLGGNVYLLGIAHFHVVDVVSGDELTPLKLGKSVRAAFDAATASVQENVALWGFEGLVLEAKGRANRQERDA